MAGDWIKLEHATPEKPEVYRLARMLGVSRGDAFLLAVEWWIWLDRNSRNGNVTHLVTQDVDDLMHCPGFATAMNTVGWLEMDDEKHSIIVPNFCRHNGKTAKDRALTKDRASEFRASNRNANSNADVTDESLQEKRREELKPLRPVSPDSFARFWLAWPSGERKVAKAKCLELWKRRRLDDIADRIVAHVTAMRGSKQWRDGYDPAPLTYLRQTRWEDEVPASTKPATDADRMRDLMRTQA